MNTANIGIRGNGLITGPILCETFRASLFSYFEVQLTITICYSDIYNSRCMNNSVLVIFFHQT